MEPEIAVSVAPTTSAVPASTTDKATHERFIWADQKPRSIVAGRPMTRLAALHRPCREVNGSKEEGKRPKRLVPNGGTCVGCVMILSLGTTQG